MAMGYKPIMRLNLHHDEALIINYKRTKKRNKKSTNISICLINMEGSLTSLGMGMQTLDV